MKRILLIATLLIFMDDLQAQDACACCSEQHQLFDFWIGEWYVYDTLGNFVGENSIEKLVADCILSEHW